MGIPFRSYMGQRIGYYRPMLRTARGIKLTDLPRFTDYRHCLNTQSRGVSDLRKYGSARRTVTHYRPQVQPKYPNCSRGQTYASVEALVLTLCTEALLSNWRRLVLTRYCPCLTLVSVMQWNIRETV